MKRHRRVEIIAFQKKVTIVSGEFHACNVDPAGSDQCVAPEPVESISPDSEEGRRILADAVRLLSDRLIELPDIESIEGKDQEVTPVEGGAV